MDFNPQRTDTCLRVGSSTTWVSSASVAAVVTVLCRAGDCFASQLRLVLVKIQPFFTDFGKILNAEISLLTQALCVSS